ncbi:MAG: aminotransferase class I/II-fold pyridoxal phosphate-dependent enzyme, partial [Proteobacteria bacterium]|nr:aminotransferase class I/II-fold pyridoxal phosphate-dependent enzyme [Pseudomonadota bacterium]
YQVDEKEIISFGNGTAALTSVLRAMNLPKGTFCVLPSWTFVATPAAAAATGFVPYFMDVDAETWALEPDAVRKQLKNIPGQVSVVMVVAPFGAPLNVADWDRFTDDTGIPVVIDAAAAFDTVSVLPQMKPGKSPMMISLHATKVCGMGEGGVVISSNKEFLIKARQMSNFGFWGSHNVSVAGTNGKMNEYSAAVGMAALDQWPQKRGAWLRLKLHYIDALKKLEPKVKSPWLNEEWVSSTCNVRLPVPDATPVIAKLKEVGIESRQWWQLGCHRKEAYQNFPKTALPNTEKLANSVIALPFSIDMKREDIDYVVNTLDKVLASVNA